MARHPAGDGVDGVLHFDALALQEVRHLADLVLRLRHGEPVAGDDDDFLRVAHQDRRVVGRRLADGQAFLDIAGTGAGRAVAAAEAAEEDVRERAVHRVAHDPREDEPARADERAADTMSA